MDFLPVAIDFIIHLDVHLMGIIAQYGLWTYGFLFVLLLCETGLVATPFLPGDSLLFATGAFAAQGVLNIWVLLPILSLGAIAGDSINYFIGLKIGQKALSIDRWFLRKRYVSETQEFYKNHGRKTIVLARFIPIVRTFAPFVAGVGEMKYGEFLLYSIIGGLLWVGLFVFGGFFFGNIPWVKKNFVLVIMGVIVLSIIPGIVEFIRRRSPKNKHDSDVLEQ